jgi:hypothetical protein
MSILNRYLTRAQLAKEFGICERTVDRWHARGEGPPRIKKGKLILYRKEAVHNWLVGEEKNPVRR